LRPALLVDIKSDMSRKDHIGPILCQSKFSVFYFVISFLRPALLVDIKSDMSRKDHIGPILCQSKFWIFYLPLTTSNQ